MSQTSPGTRGHYVSAVPDELWAEATAAAAENGETIAAVMRRALEEYARPPVDHRDVCGRVLTYRLTERGVEVSVLLDDPERLRFTPAGWRLMKKS